MKTKTNLLIAALLLLGSCAGGFSQSLSTVQFTKGSYSVNENGASVTLTVERIGEAGGTAYVEYATLNGTATDGEDYSAQSGSLWFNGETNLTIVIPILNDPVSEPDETFFIDLFNAEPIDTQLGANTKAAVTIYDDDPLTVEIRASFTNVAVGFDLDLTGLVAGHADASRWDFGDGIVVSNQLQVSHHWLTPENYAVVWRGRWCS